MKKYGNMTTCQTCHCQAYFYTGSVAEWLELVTASPHAKENGR